MTPNALATKFVKMGAASIEGITPRSNHGLKELQANTTELAIDKMSRLPSYGHLLFMLVRSRTQGTLPN